MMKGGYELRNPYYKNSSSPKTITTIKNNAEKVAVFEGFFDFLSFLVITDPGTHSGWNYCILNSISFFQKARLFIEQHSNVHLFLDNDEAGQNCSAQALSFDKMYINESGMYANYKDLNEWLVKIGK